MSKTSIAKFMNLKGFHPSNFHNQKKVWIAEQKKESDARRQKAVDEEYAKEQSIHDTRGFAMQGRTMTESERKRHEVNFMYEPPPGFKTEGEEDKTQGNALESGKLTMSQMKALPMEEKFAFLKGAPKLASYVKDMEVVAKPFGIELKNIRCLRCKKWGHEHTERVCPLFAVDILKEDEFGKEDPALLMKEMHENGFSLSKRALDRTTDLAAANQQLLVDEEEEAQEFDDPDLAYLASLSEKDKKKLLKKLEKMQKKEEKKSKKKESKHAKHKEGGTDSDSASEWQETQQPDSPVQRRQRSRSPQRRRSRSPPRQRSRSPPRQRSRSPPRHSKSSRDERESRRSPQQRESSSRSSHRDNHRDHDRSHNDGRHRRSPSPSFSRR